MKYTISDPKLKTIIDELGEEYKDLLIEQILDDMNEVDADYISPSDLIKLDVTTKENLRKDRYSQRRNRMYSIMSLLGITYALMGFVLMFLRLYEWRELSGISQDALMTISIILIIIGLFVALFSLLYRQMPRIRPRNYKQNYVTSTYEVINKWKEIESMIYELTPNSDKSSLSIMIKNLNDSRILSDQDIETINHLLSVRNQIIHGKKDNIEYDNSELRILLLDSDKLINRLKKII